MKGRQMSQLKKIAAAMNEMQLAELSFTIACIEGLPNPVVLGWTSEEPGATEAINCIVSGGPKAMPSTVYAPHEDATEAMRLLEKYELSLEKHAGLWSAWKPQTQSFGQDCESPMLAIAVAVVALMKVH